ncbi:MAG TPA: hypothetical protein VMV18_11330 [bacterium]|nr:hypothetical protein [bacterium]
MRRTLALAGTLLCLVVLSAPGRARADIPGPNGERPVRPPWKTERPPVENRKKACGMGSGIVVLALGAWAAWKFAPRPAALRP